MSCTTCEGFYDPALSVKGSTPCTISEGVYVPAPPVTVSTSLNQLLGDLRPCTIGEGVYLTEPAVRESTPLLLGRHQEVKVANDPIKTSPSLRPVNNDGSAVTHRINKL